MARYSEATLAKINLGVRLEELASQAMSRAARIERVLHSRMRGNDCGASERSASEAKVALEQALEALVEAMDVLHIDEEV